MISDLRDAEFALHYRPRTTLPVSPSKILLVGEAKCIEHLFKDLPAYVTKCDDNRKAIIGPAEFRWFNHFMKAPEKLLIDLGPVECEEDDLTENDYWVYHD